MPETWALPTRRTAAGVCLLACSALAACAGSGEASRKPTALLSSSPTAEAEMRKLVASFARGSARERADMEPTLATFRAGHDDDLGKLAEILLTWIALDKGKLQVAELRARALRKDLGPGSAGDLALTVEGAALRRSGRAKEALELLYPLVSKLIDPWARSLYNQEVVDAAVAAGEWKKAIELMRVWLRESGAEERSTARARIEQLLEKVPPNALTDQLSPGVLGSDEDAEMKKLVAQRLAAVARATKDADLAARLLNTSGTLLGEQGDSVAQLAAGASKARVEARTVGLLLSLRDATTRRRGADIAEGVTFGLGLPGSAARLVSRDDHGTADRLDEALAALSADGASILIAGGDEESATRAAKFAEDHKIPVLLLRPPAPGTLPDGKGRFSFVVGSDPAEVEAALVSALVAKGAGPVAVLTDEPARKRTPRPDVVGVRGCGEASLSWKSMGASSLVLAGPAECAKEGLIAAAPLRMKFAGGLELDNVPLPLGSQAATAGIFPIGMGRPPALAGWMKDHATPPSFWAALGHDAAVLAWAGVKELPAQGTEDPAEVEARRAWAASLLEKAQGELWTTEARGFAGARVLARAVGVREVR